MGRKGFDSAAFLSKVGAGKTNVDCQKDQVLFAQGDPANAVFYIQSGKVKMTVVSEHGKEAVVALLKIGSFFGEGCLNGQPRRLATATAFTKAAVLRIAKDEMVRVLKTESAFAARFLSYLLQRNSRIEEDLIDQLFNSSEKRLARVLLLLANFGKDSEPEPVLPKILKQTGATDIASAGEETVGATPSSRDTTRL